jgi:thiazole synthase ThiGH ThiG subunit
MHTVLASERLSMARAIALALATGAAAKHARHEEKAAAYPSD